MIGRNRSISYRTYANTQPRILENILISKKAFLVYLPRYATQNDPFWEMSDGEIEARFLAGLRRIGALPRETSREGPARNDVRRRRSLCWQGRPAG